MRPPSPRRPGGSRPQAEQPVGEHTGGPRASEDGEASPEEATSNDPGHARQGTALEPRTVRHALATPVAATDAASLLGGENTTDLRDRLRERSRARRVLLVRRIAIALFVLSVLVVTTWAVFFSPLFALSSSSVVVSGQDGTLVTPEAVRSSIAPFEGVPLTRLNTDAVARAVESNVAVRSASVSRRWPTSLRITVSMRVGVAVEESGGGYWLIDDQGVAFEQVSGAGSYPIATLPQDRAQGASDIASALGALDEGTRSQVAAITSTGSQVSFTLRGGQVVKWGTSADAPQKARVLATLLANVTASTYDVSSPNHPVTS